MSEPRIIIDIDESGRIFQPGETISGEFRLESFDFAEIKAVEVSVLWYTEGKGDEDLDVHEFKRISADDLNWNEFRRPNRFETVLPNSPLTYDGVILKVCWCVRVRVFPRRGREIVAELPFVLGEICNPRGQPFRKMI